MIVRHLPLGEGAFSYFKKEAVWKSIYRMHMIIYSLNHRLYINFLELNLVVL